MPLKLEIVTPEARIYSDDVDTVVLPGYEGEMGVLPAHSNLVTTLLPGELRITKGGKEIWLQASYNPIYDMNGKPFKVVEYATDITKAKLESADFAGQIDLRVIHVLLFPTYLPGS